MIVYDLNNETTLDPSRWTRESDLDSFLFDRFDLVVRVVGDAHDLPEGVKIIPLSGPGGQVFRIDVLFLLHAPDGGFPPTLLVFEDKRGESDDLRRKVVGQVLEYVARLDGCSAEEFRDEVITRMKTNKTALPADLTQEEAVGLAVDAKEAGRFWIFVCADDVRPELISTMQWLNDNFANPPRGFRNLLAEVLHVEPLEAEGRTLVRLAALIAESLHQEPSEAQLEQVLEYARTIANSETLVQLVETIQLGDGEAVAFDPRVSPPTGRSSRRADLESIDSFFEVLKAEVPTSEAAVRRIVERFEQLQTNNPHLFSIGLKSASLNLYIRTPGGRLTRIFALNSRTGRFYCWLDYLRNHGHSDVAEAIRQSVEPTMPVPDGKASSRKLASDDNVEDLLDVVDEVAEIVVEHFSDE